MLQASRPNQSISADMLLPHQEGAARHLKGALSCKIISCGSLAAARLVISYRHIVWPCQYCAMLPCIAAQEGQV